MRPLNISELATGCHTGQLARKANSEHCQELFHRALAQQDQQAWEAIYLEFSRMVQGWVYTYSRFRDTDEPASYFVNEAFARLWKFGSCHAQAGRFEALSSYLQFLKMCVGTAIEDYLRKTDKDALRRAAYPLDKDGKEEFSMPLSDIPPEWSFLVKDVQQALLETTQEDKLERLVAEGAWVHGLSPRDIQAEHPDLFCGADQVSQIKSNILRRLKRHPSLLKWLDE